MMMLAVMVLAFTILGFAGAGAVIPFAHNSFINPPGPATANLGNNGPHGLSEMLYTYTSAVGNNGSAFAGINANTPYFNTTIGIAMLFGRFLMLIPLLAAAGSLAQKKQVPASSGTFPTHSPLFVALLVGVVVIVGALTFFPALSLGPVVEHFLMNAGKLWS
jgi:K+-transporting ATPase ATPase A chain